MSPKRPKPGQKDGSPPPPEPLDVVDGIPDRSPRSRLWIYLVLALVFLAWLAFLIFVQLAPLAR